jgi:hypothetical protein
MLRTSPAVGCILGLLKVKVSFVIRMYEIHARARAHNLRYCARASAQVKHHAVHHSPAGQQSGLSRGLRATIKGPSSAWSIWRSGGRGRGGGGREGKGGRGGGGVSCLYLSMIFPFRFVFWQTTHRRLALPHCLRPALPSCLRTRAARRNAHYIYMCVPDKIHLCTWAGRPPAPRHGSRVVHQAACVRAYSRRP